ncbi:MAG: class I SAM-dependent methyltransferase [Verrucomicrobia bacterium]|nr:class I SAM-dependent methyltransferase [Verrucomicrobiota bacterium]MBS0636219.1 class I SAM-dependent methyltransferase [Verrucomicrobiota bacterium]
MKNDKDSSRQNRDPSRQKQDSTRQNNKDTSWQKVGQWYDSIVGDQGSYYHQQIILPHVMKLLDMQSGASLLDLGCGQGVLAGRIPKDVGYLGLDAAKSLLAKAKARHKGRSFQFADLTKPLVLPSHRLFTHACCILALQNMAEPDKVLANIKPYLAPNAKLVLVLNHPCFRIPRQSSWGFDEAAKLQYRRVNSYMSPQKIPIFTNPGQETSETTYSFHHPLSAIFGFLKNSGFLVQGVEEWCSDKVSEGKAARWENRARKEFPLFMGITCVVS